MDTGQKSSDNKSTMSVREKNRLYSIYEGCSGRAIFNLTSGAFFVGFLKYIGASDALCGKIAAIPVLTAMIQFISPIFIERLSWKLTLITIGSFFHRFLLFSMIIIPLLPISVNSKLVVVSIIYFISYLLIGFIMPAISNLIVSSVPQNIRGKYFGIRESYILLYSTVVTLILGKVLDVFKDNGNQYTGYIIIFIIILFNNIINTWAFAKTKEVRIRPNPNIIKLKDVFTIPVKDKRFRKIIIMFTLWSVGLQFGAQFFGIYQVSTLELSYTYISTNTMIFSISYWFATRIWGKLADKRSWMYTSLLSIGLLGVVHFSWLFVFKGTMLIYILVPFLHILAGIAWGGINISIFNIQFDYTPNEGRTLYLGFNAAFSGAIGYIAAYFSSELVGAFEGFKTYMLGVPITITQIVLSGSGVIISLCAIYIFVFLKEKSA